MKFLSLLFLVIFATTGFAQTPNPQPLSQKLADTAMNRIWVDDGNPPGIPRRWTYEQGVILEGIEAVWHASGDPKYLAHIKAGMDFWLENGAITGYTPDKLSLDDIAPGTALLTLFRATGDEKYKNAAVLLRSQLKNQPRTKEGGFWHKKTYPYQMWLDGLYMAEPFYAEYAALFNEPEDFDDIANQFVWMEKHARDEKTGLIFHGWDESREQLWADKTNGRSPNIWGRAMGWYAMALVDVLDHFPQNHPRRAELVAILGREAAAIEKFQDQDGLWWQVVDKANAPKNYHESSSAAMFVYALAKGVRQGNLPKNYLDVAQKGWTGVKREFIETLADGNADWKGTVAVAGLGGKPYRDGTYDYYVSEKVVVNDPKGLGAAILAAVEMEKAGLR